ncbi:hypothetical protein [uncultured Psychroserpens sp.]|uniref:hypothetical protein n=1 Tax=uncultured Psychroserpens sp. TaxID=255436 RepID=UPI0026273CF9|nr:hypothetical protein [uncultured Psychroserpens sp.]
MNKDKIKRDIDKLIEKGNLATKNNFTSGYEYYSELGFFSGFKSSSLSYVRRLLGENDTYYINLLETLNSNKLGNAEGAISILQSIKEAIDEDWLFNMKDIISAEIFSDFMEMAKYLLDEKYKDASAVMIGSVLEEHLRQLATKNNIELTFLDKKENPKPKKADLLNSEITKSGAYSPLDQKQVTAWLGIRNKAAHGEYDFYDQRQIEIMYQGVLDFMIRTRI